MRISDADPIGTLCDSIRPGSRFDRRLITFCRRAVFLISQTRRIQKLLVKFGFESMPLLWVKTVRKEREGIMTSKGLTRMPSWNGHDGGAGCPTIFAIDKNQAPGGVFRRNRADYLGSNHGSRNFYTIHIANDEPRARC